MDLTESYRPPRNQECPILTLFYNFNQRQVILALHFNWTGLKESPDARTVVHRITT